MNKIINDLHTLSSNQEEKRSASIEDISHTLALAKDILGEDKLVRVILVHPSERDKLIRNVEVGTQTCGDTNQLIAGTGNSCFGIEILGFSLIPTSTYIPFQDIEEALIFKRRVEELHKKGYPFKSILTIINLQDANRRSL